MNILQDILSGQNGAIIKQLAGQFGLDEKQIEAAVGNLVPALSSGIQKNTADEQGLQSLLGAIEKGSHERYIDQPDMLAQDQTIKDGNGILGHIFGSKDVSREVANRASQETGIGSSILKKMLPLLATTVMGALGKQSRGSSGVLSGLLGVATGGSSVMASGAIGMLTKFLDADKDGSVMDDILGMIAKRSA